MAYTLEALRDLARSKADDVSDASGRPNHLHSDDELDRMANEAVRQACRRRRLIYDETTPRICSITLRTGIRAYEIDSRITAIDQILYDGLPLLRYSLADMNAKDSEWRTRTGEPTEYAQQGHVIYLNPTPTATESGQTLTLCCYRLPLSDMRDNSDTPEIMGEFHYDLVFWMLHEMFSRRDSDTNAEQLAAKFRAMFDESFGRPVSAGVRDNQLSTPASSVIAPVSYSIE